MALEKLDLTPVCATICYKCSSTDIFVPRPPHMCIYVLYILSINEDGASTFFVSWLYLYLRQNLFLFTETLEFFLDLQSLPCTLLKQIECRSCSISFFSDHSSPPSVLPSDTHHGSLGLQFGYYSLAYIAGRVTWGKSSTSGDQWFQSSVCTAA